MKRIGNLFTQIITLENLYLASTNAQKGKKKYKEIIKWNENLEENILKLQKELQNKSYVVSEYFVFKIHEPKERIISKLPFKDRVVPHALLNILEPIFLASFTIDTYSCIKGRGIHKGLKMLTKSLKDKTNSYCLKLDIRKFYPSVDHDILKSLLRAKFKDSNLMWLLDTVIDSCAGLALGNFSSQ